jgi:hypothetical protein
MLSSLSAAYPAGRRALPGNEAATCLSAAYPAGRVATSFAIAAPLLSAAYPAGRACHIARSVARRLSAAYPAGRYLKLTPENLITLSAAYPAGRFILIAADEVGHLSAAYLDQMGGFLLALPSLAEGQTNRPFSSRFRNMQAPWPSHQITLTRSPRRPRKTNRCPPNGFCCVFRLMAGSDFRG